MKGMTTEQKAKAYDKAIAHAKMLLKTIGNATLGNLVLKNEFEIMFPELAEDERIRKAIIEFFELQDDNTTYSLVPKKDIIAWLEKQSKQKPADKAEPKFKVGDWIVYKDTVWKVCNISLLNYYELLKINNEVSTRTIEDVDKTAHLWTFKDAKDGDVLVNNDACYIVLFKRFSYSEDGIDRFKSCCHCCEGVFSSIEYTGWCCNGFHPATKEQRDLLFQKMKESGYEWDANKKELKKIEQKSAWSEEDEKIWKELIEEVKDQIDSVPAPDCRYKEDEKVLKQLNKWLTWLKSIKDRVQLPLKQE